MPNKTGGKNYKKSKHATSAKPIFIDRQEDQMYGRVVKNLGNRNMLVYGNDNRVRICHIRGSMRKRVWINPGDIVLISLRDFELAAEDKSKLYDRGDIIAKYEEENLNKLRKMPDVNKKLFQQLETTDGQVLAEIGRKENEFRVMPKEDEEDDDIFDHALPKRWKKGDDESGSEEEDGSEESDSFDIDKI